jgi:hypothetical protein
MLEAGLIGISLVAIALCVFLFRSESKNGKLEKHVERLETERAKSATAVGEIQVKEAETKEGTRIVKLDDSQLLDRIKQEFGGQEQ